MRRLASADFWQLLAEPHKPHASAAKRRQPVHLPPPSGESKKHSHFSTSVKSLSTPAHTAVLRSGSAMPLPNPHADAQGTHQPGATHSTARRRSGGGRSFHFLLLTGTVETRWRSRGHHRAALGTHPSLARFRNCQRLNAKLVIRAVPAGFRACELATAMP